MNHGWPNLGHDSLVHAVQDAACDLTPRLQASGLRVRALSYDVRRSQMIPEPPGGRFTLYLGTGGPGHIDPHRNDGFAPGTQGVAEDPAWEPRLFALFDQIQASSEGALIAVCHTFGVMCRWSGVAQAVLRSAQKGGKSAGILENMLTAEAVGHPWFSRLADERRPPARLRARPPALRPRARAGAAARGHGRDRPRDAGRRRTAGRCADHARVRARREGRDAARVRGEPPPRDRGPRPPDARARAEAREGRGHARMVRGAARACWRRRTATPRATAASA